MRIALPALAVALAAMPGAAEAHAFAQRYDLPLPLWHYLAGAGAAVAASFLIAALVLRVRVAVPQARFAIPPGLARAAALSLNLCGVAAFALLLAAGLFGEQGDWDSNILPVTVWIVWWVGLVFVCAALGDLWTPLDPWRTIGRSLGKLFARDEAPRAWPERLGEWPTVALFFAFAWCELAWTENAMPRKLAMLILAYSALTWTGMAAFGVETWRAKADPFARFFALFARFAPLAMENGKLVLRPFGAGLVQDDLAQDEPPSPAVCGFVILMLATVAFDGIAETPLWDAIVGAAMLFLYDAGIVKLIGYTWATSLVKTLGLIATPLLFAAAYLAICLPVARLAGEPVGRTARRYVLTLVPIAIAYHLAHYLSYLLLQGQMIWPLLSDPLNLGWNLWGGQGYQIDIAAVGMEFVWLFAVAAIVIGHVAAVALSHAEALRDAPAHIAVRSQAPMMLFMVGYTMLSLWILSQPIVEN